MKSWKTAIARKKLPVPTRFLLENDLLRGSVLDYGCGKCHDLNNQHFVAEGFDPHFRPIALDKKYDTIICNYVLNVVPDDVRSTILEKIKSLLNDNGTAYVAVRRDMASDYTTKDTEQFLVELDYPTVVKNSNFEIYKISF